MDDEHDATTQKNLGRSIFFGFFGCQQAVSLEAKGAMLPWPCCHGSGGDRGSGSFVLCARLSGITS